MATATTKVIHHEPQVTISTLNTLTKEKEQFQLELQQIDQRISTIAHEGPHVFTGCLIDELLPSVLKDPLERKYTLLSFNHLASSSVGLAISTLKESVNNLYEYRGNSEFQMLSPLVSLQPLANEYMKQYPYHHFGRIIEHIQKLAERNLSDFESALLEERKKLLEPVLELKSLQIQKEMDESIKTQEILGKGAAHYGRGNFDFISESMSRQMLQSAFDAIEEASLWNKIPTQPTDESVRLLRADPEFNKKVQVVICAKDGHSGSSLGWTINSIVRLHSVGWEEFRNQWVARYQAK